MRETLGYILQEGLIKHPHGYGWTLHKIIVITAKKRNSHNHHLFRIVVNGRDRYA